MTGCVQYALDGFACPPKKPELPPIQSCSVESISSKIKLTEQPFFAAIHLLVGRQQKNSKFGAQMKMLVCFTRPYS